MSDPLPGAATRLLHVLTAENAALARMDLAGASSLLAEKTMAAAGFDAALLGRPAFGAGGFAASLKIAAAENRRLLERAMAVQTRVLGVLAQAAKAAQPPDRAGAYGRHGLPPGRPPPAWALRAQA